jgi:predicted Zn-dependent peptidase
MPRVPAAGVGELVGRTTLGNGVLVLTEHIPSVRSASIGVWIRKGGAHEGRRDFGASHLLEHMVFKGTRRRTSPEIAVALESLGGSLDAYTSREHTSYQARVLDEHLPDALDVLSDLVIDPLLRQEDLDLEREVVLEEIAQVEDTPDDLVFELHGDMLWKGHPYGRSILGSKDSVAGMSAETLRELHQEGYRGANLVVAAAGNVTHADFVDRVDDLFGHVTPGSRSEAVSVPDGADVGFRSVTRESAQTHIVFGTSVPGRAHPDRFALILLSSALGGGMSSRLFQRVREELALCYSVYTYQSFYASAGVAGIYVGTRPSSASQAVDAVRAELGRLAGAGLPADELKQTKSQVKGQAMLALESTGARLHRLASFDLYDEPFLGIDELLERIDGVTAEDIQRVAAEYYDPDRQFILAMGPT